MPTVSAEPGQSPPRTGPRVLIVRPSALGDVARTVPCLVTLRGALPAARIDWLVQDSFADVIRCHPMLDGVIEFPRQQLTGLLGPIKAMRWSRLLKRSQYDIAIDLQGLFRSGWLSLQTRAPRRIGYANARELGWLCYNRRHHVDETLHTVDRMLALLAAEGYPISHDMRLYPGAENDRWLDAWLQPLAASQAPGSNDRHYIVLAPTARWRCKCWPLENYAAIARRLLDERLTRHLVILASPAEQAQVMPLVEALKASHPQAKISLPATTIGQMMAVISRAGLVLCNDSGPLHIAVGFDRPIVTIFGPTDPALVGPYRRDDSVVRPPDAEPIRGRGYYRRHRDDQTLIAKVTVEAVWECVLQQLGSCAPA